MGEPRHARLPLAVVTTVRNEVDLLPVWCRHYARQVGLAHCHVIDHGSDRGLDLLAALPNVRTLPPSAMDENWRVDMVAEFCRELLLRYNYVLVVDADELVVADPRRAATLAELCRGELPPVTTLFGLDVVQTAEEAPIDFTRPISRQRHYGRPSTTVCKPTLIREPVRWGAGFHYAPEWPSLFAGVYLFHIAYVDFGLLERRQRERNQTPRADTLGGHHRIPPNELARHIAADYVALPRIEQTTLGGDRERDMRQFLLQAGTPAPGGQHIASAVQICELWRIPGFFVDTF